MGDAQKNKIKILECARELFYCVGYQITSVDDILKKCRVAKSNFYYHFESKEQLAFSILDWELAELESLVARSLRNETLTPGQRLNAYFTALCQKQLENAWLAGCPFGNFAAALPSPESDPRAEKFRQRLSKVFTFIEDALRDCLADGMETREFRRDFSASDLAVFFIAEIEGQQLLTKTHKDMARMVKGMALLEKLLKP